MSHGRVLFCRGEEDEADHDDIWEDSELIAAYDRALASARAELGMTDVTAEEKPSKKWRIGGFCRAVFSEDGLTYEAEILSIGGARCRLRYVGYGNEEDQPLARLQPSAGKKARKKQEREAEQERVGEEEEAAEGACEDDDGRGEDSGEGGDTEEEMARMGRTAPGASGRARKSAAGRDGGGRQRGPGTGQAGYSGGEQSRPAAGAYPGQDHSGPWGPHLWPGGAPPETWGPPPGPWGPPPAPWGAVPPFAGPRGPSVGPWAPPSRATPGTPLYPRLPPPPPPPPVEGDPVQVANMLMSWYISGYHTGYYQARRDAASEAGGAK